MLRSCFALLAAVAAVVFGDPTQAAPLPAPIPKPPDVAAKAYILVDHFSGRVLAGEHADERVEPASLTKLMTSYAVFKALKENRLKLSDPVVISEHAWRSEGSRTFVQVGSTVPAEVLIKGMIVQSGNDATIALAEKNRRHRSCVRAAHERVRQAPRHAGNQLRQRPTDCPRPITTRRPATWPFLRTP